GAGGERGELGGQLERRQARGLVEELELHTGTTAPVTADASSESRKAIVAATAAGWVPPVMPAARFAAVSISAGVTALTRIPRSASSSASTCVSRMTAAFETAEAAEPVP